MTPIQKLDSVLDFFARGGFEKGGISLDTLLRLLDSKMDSALDMDELIKITNQLLADHYISENKYNQYQVTYRGIIFNDQKGYQGQMEKAHEVRALQQSQMETQQKITVLTRWIAVGTSIAALYYLIEIVKNLTRQ